MSTEPAKGCMMLKAKQRMAVALSKGLSTDTSGIDSKPVYRKLQEDTSKPQYDAMWHFWLVYHENFPDEDIRTIKGIKHLAEAVANSVTGRINKDGFASEFSVRTMMRRLISAWQRETHETIPKEVHDSVTPYIQNVLREKVPLSTEVKPPTFLTIENYVDMEDLLWLRDHHNYVHEGCRVDVSALLKAHCFTAARLREICMAVYKDLVCMVSWKDNEPEIKIGFKREFAKGMQDTSKKPKHPFYERLNPTPPLFANGLLFLLGIIISAGAFRDYTTMEDVLDARPPPGRKYRIMDWADAMLEAPVFPEMSADGPTEKPKSPSTWSRQSSNWAKRADFTDGMGLHAPRRETLIKTDDGGYSLGQVMKFAAHRNSKTLVGHYLDDMSNVDGAAVFLGLEQRRDLTEDFRSASMKRNPDLQHSLPAKCLDELRRRRDFTDLCEQNHNLAARMTAASTEKERQELQAQRRYVYDQRKRLIDQELAKYRETQPQFHTTQPKVDDQGEWHRSYFERVVRHMVPERDRLARTLPIAASLRSPQGISALQDLIALRKNDSRVAYQEALRPIEDRCPTCLREIKDIAVKDRWQHVYRCSRGYHEKHSGFAEFCFLCRRWINSKTDWEDHCQDHIDNLNVPFRCEPITFRHAVACAGYCCGCLRKDWLPAAVRMTQFRDRPSWQRHISNCIPEYVGSLDSMDSIPCPHLLCPVVLDSESDLWNHLGDIHSTHQPNAQKKRQRDQEEGGDEGAGTSGAAARTKRRLLLGKLEDNDCTVLGGQSAPKGRSRGPLGDTFVNVSSVDFDSCPADVFEMAVVSGNSLTSCSTPRSSVLDRLDDCASPLSSLSDDILEAVPQAGCHCPWKPPLEAAIVKPLGDSEPGNFGATADGISPPFKSQDDWILSPTAPPSQLSIISTELIDPELRDALPCSASILPTIADSVEDADGSRRKTTPGHMETSVTQPPDSQPVAIDAKEGIWEAEALLAKWKRGNAFWYLVKWKGFPHEGNTWEKRKDISTELVEELEASYKGNHSGVRLIEKRVRRGKVEYLVEWKGRPKSEKSWEKAATISRERIVEFEAS